MANWNTTDIKSWNELDKDFYWHQGYFHVNYEGNENYQRDWDEQRLRDYAVFTLGELKGKTILDMGCGYGLYSLTFLMMGAELVCGQDIDKEALDKAISIMEKFNFQYKVGDCAEIQYEDNYFDLVFAGDLFEHVTLNKKKDFISEAYRVLKPGGIFTIKTPNKSYLKITNLLHRIKAIIKFRNPFNIHIAHTRNNPDNEHHGLTTHKELIGLFEETFFHKPEITTSDFNKNLPRWICRILSKYRLNAQITISVTKPIFYGIYQ